MTRPVVVDASVAAKWFLSEPGWSAFELLEAGMLHAPSLLRVEIASAISRRHRVGELDEGDARVMFVDAQTTLRWPAFRFIEDEVLLPRASEISLLLKHPLPDCLYIACAERFTGDLLTVDLKLLSRTASELPFVRAL